MGSVEIEDSTHTILTSAADGQLPEPYGYDTVFFDFWLECFGDHVHHGFYENIPEQLENGSALKDDLSTIVRDAALRLIDKLLVWANIADDDLYKPWKILDVGSCAGGVSRYFAKRFGSVATSVQGISLGKLEVETAKKITSAENLSDKVSFMVADALELPFPDNAYDLVWCMESADHILEKQQLIKELARVTTPGGRIVLTSMCCPEEVSALSENDKETIRNIAYTMSAAPLSPLSSYVVLAQEQGLEEIKSDNWTKYVIPGVHIWSHFESASVNASEVGDYFDEFLPLLKGYEQGLVHYGVFTATKPCSSSQKHKILEDRVSETMLKH